MPAQGDTERYLFPSNPHTKTNAEVEGTESHPTFQSAPGIAPIRTFAIESTHPIASRWRDVCNQIIEILEREGISFVAIECFRRRQHPTKTDDIPDDATIVITVKDLPPMTDDLWEMLRDIHELSGGLFVELIRGQIWPHSCGADKGLNVNLPYAGQPAMGASIGVSLKPTVTGTLGGYIELFKEGVVKSCVLTCSHVLTPSPPGGKGEEKFENHSTIRVFHPSAVDHETTVARARRTVEFEQSYTKQLEEKLNHFGESGMNSREIIDASRLAIKKWEACIDAADSVDRQIGRGFAGSGCEILPGRLPEGGCRIDWGLIEVASGRIGTNKYPGEDDKTIVMAREPRKDDWVSIIGRTSGISNGIVNGIESCVKSYDERGNELTSMEWTVVDNYPGRPFSRKGDSGAFVIYQGVPSVMGILWGGNDNGWSDISYFTPIKVVAKDILKRTKYHVRLPGGNHICC